MSTFTVDQVTVHVTDTEVELTGSALHDLMWTAINLALAAQNPHDSLHDRFDEYWAALVEVDDDPESEFAKGRLRAARRALDTYLPASLVLTRNSALGLAKVIERTAPRQLVRGAA